MKDKKYNHTMTACFVGYIVQAIVNHFAPLIKDGEKGMSLKELAGKKLFWVLMLLMLCGGRLSGFASGRSFPTFGTGQKAECG